MSFWTGAFFFGLWLLGGLYFAIEEILSTPQRNRTRDAWTRVRGISPDDPLNQNIALTSDAPMGFWTLQGVGGRRWIGPQPPPPVRDQPLRQERSQRDISIEDFEQALKEFRQRNGLDI